MVDGSVIQIHSLIFRANRWIENLCKQLKRHFFTIPFCSKRRLVIKPKNLGKNKKKFHCQNKINFPVRGAGG